MNIAGKVSSRRNCQLAVRKVSADLAGRTDIKMFFDLDLSLYRSMHLYSI